MGFKNKWPSRTQGQAIFWFFWFFFKCNFLVEHAMFFSWLPKRFEIVVKDCLRGCKS